jgi:ribonucleoside-diphosphate reductase alpha chain
MGHRVKKRNGRLEPFKVNKINVNVERAGHDLPNACVSEVIFDAEIGLYDKIKTEDIDIALILAARSKTYEDPDYCKMASRLVRNCIYKEVFKESVDSDTFEADYKSAFIRNIKKQVKEGRLDPRNLGYDLKVLANAIDVDRDDLLTYVAIQNIKDRYLLRKSTDKKIFETPQAYYMRVAMGLCYNQENKEEAAIALYNCYSTHRSSPSTPTLFNSATTHNQLSSCYLSEIDDSVDGIFDGLWQEARKSKYAGGLGFHVSKIRAMGSHIKGTNGRSSGLIPWLKVYNDMLIACDQAGKRQGSGCAYLEPWHLDIEDFIDLRKETGEERRRCHDLNTALWCPDLFFDRIKNDADWTLFCPSETPDLPDLYGEEFNLRYEEYENQARNGDMVNFRVIKAKELWKTVLKSLFETSHPWITHKDNANMRYSNAHEGPLHGSNLCTEIFLHTKHSEYKDGIKTEVGETAVCNLASIVLPKHVKDGKLDTEKLAETVELTIRGLNSVIDINFYPTKEAEKSNLAHRPIGLGTMGFNDLCHLLDVVQDSNEGVQLADEVAEFISYHAILTSSRLAKEEGKYSTYEGSKWSQNIFPIDTYNELMKWKNPNHVEAKESENLDWEYVRDHVKKYGMRNSNTMAIAPNASISYQMGCTQSIEPDKAVLFVYENKSGQYYLLNTNFVNDMKKEGLWNKEFADQVREADGAVKDLDIPERYKAKYRNAFDKDQFKLIEANAARQKWIDMGISFNCWNNKTSLKYINDLYVYSNELGLKSNYYLRGIAASQIAKSSGTTVQERKEETPEEDAANACSLEAMMSGGSCEMCEG